MVMLNTRRAGRWLVVAALVTAALPAAADRKTDERLANIERKLDSRGLVDMLNRLEQMQQDLQQLRGQQEELSHRLDGFERRQREQYMHIDRRLQQLETGTAGMAPMPGTGAPMPGMAPMPGTDPGTGAPGSPPPVAPVAPVTPVAPATPVTPEMPVTPATPAPPPAVVADPAVMQAEYDTALAILREGRYTDAALAFKQFLVRHPTGPLSGNASYWLGETYYVTRDFDQSLATFTSLVNNFPQSPKLSDSRLKIGYIHYEKKDWKAARTELEAVVSTYPGTTAARLAADRLARMKKEGH